MRGLAAWLAVALSACAAAPPATSPARASAPTGSAPVAAPVAPPDAATQGGGVARAAETPDDAFRREPPPPREAAPFAPPPATRLLLHNGIPVYVVAQPSIFCAVRVLARGGIGDAPPGRLDGMDLTNAMLSGMTAGTTTRDYRALEGAFATLFVPPLNWEVFYDAVSLSVQAPTDKLAQVIELLGDIVLRPSFDAKLLDRYREQNGHRLEDGLLDGGAIAEHVLLRTLFGGHPYGAFPTPARTRAVTRAAVVDLHARVFQAERLAIVVAGPITPADVQGPLEGAFGTAAPAAPVPTGASAPAPGLPPPPPPSGARLVVVDKPGAAIADVQAGFSAPPFSVPEGRAAWIAVDAFQRRLVRRVREELGLASGFAALEWDRGSAALLGWRSRGPNAQVGALITEVDAALRAIAADGLTPDELAVAREARAFSFASSFGTAARAAGAYGAWIAHARPIDELPGEPARIAALTADEVRAAAGRHLQPARMRVVVVGDWASLRAPLLALGWGPVELRDTAGAIVKVERADGAPR